MLVLYANSLFVRLKRYLFSHQSLPGKRFTKAQGVSNESVPGLGEKQNLGSERLPLSTMRFCAQLRLPLQSLRQGEEDRSNDWRIDSATASGSPQTDKNDPSESR